MRISELFRPGGEMESSASRPYEVVDLSQPQLNPAELLSKAMEVIKETLAPRLIIIDPDGSVVPPDPSSRIKLPGNKPSEEGVGLIKKILEMEKTELVILTSRSHEDDPGARFGKGEGNIAKRLFSLRKNSLSKVGRPVLEELERLGVTAENIISPPAGLWGHFGFLRFKLSLGQDKLPNLDKETSVVWIGDSLMDERGFRKYITMQRIKNDAKGGRYVFVKFPQAFFLPI